MREKSQNCEKLQLPFLFSGGNKKVWVFFQNGEKKVRTVRRKLNQKQIRILSLYLTILSIFSELRKKKHNCEIKTCYYLFNFFIPWQEPKIVLYSVPVKKNLLEPLFFSVYPHNIGSRELEGCLHLIYNIIYVLNAVSVLISSVLASKNVNVTYEYL